jgi:protein phosphatase
MGHWVSRCCSDVGRVRQLNEDACLALPEQGVWAVADGMGGHSAGDVASQATVAALAEAAVPHGLGGFVDRVTARLREVNRELLAEARRREQPVVGATVVILLALGTHVAYLWAGDSRVYLYRAGRLRQLSRDHSAVAELVEQGLLTPEQAARDPRGNVVTRAMGGAGELELAAEILALCPGDRFLLCSDGLCRELPDPDIAAGLAAHPGPEAAPALVAEALARGGRDNVTVVVAAWRDEPAGSPGGEA